MSRTLVYIASGGYKKDYEKLQYDRVFLVDTWAFPRFQSKKVQMLRQDALDAVKVLHANNIKIDCLVTLCESVGEGGQTYATCSDTFMGYIMPVLSKDFIWICNNRMYYPIQYRSIIDPSKKHPTTIYNSLSNNDRMRSRYGYNFVSLNLPYDMWEIYDSDPDYLSPALFMESVCENNKGHVYKMRYAPAIETIILPGNITIRLIQDSIWNHYDELDYLFISFKLGYFPMKNYFENIDKVDYYKQMEFGAKLRWADLNRLNHIGFTPHYWYQYDKNYQKQLESFIRGIERPMVIDFYYMNSGFNTRHIRKAAKTIQQERSSHL